MVQDGGELVAETFAEGGGGLDEDIVAVQCGEDDLALKRPGNGELMEWVLVTMAYLKFFLPKVRRKVNSRSMVGESFGILEVVNGWENYLPIPTH